MHRFWSKCCLFLNILRKHSFVVSKYLDFFSHLHQLTCTHELNFLCLSQAFINTAKEIYEKIQEGVFDINNEVRHALVLSSSNHSVFPSAVLCSSLCPPFSSPLSPVVFQQCVWFAIPPLCLKGRGEKKLLSASFDSSQAKLPAFFSSPALFSTHSFFTPHFSLTLSLSASCQLINSSHPTRSQSLGKKTNTQPASQ